MIMVCLLLLLDITGASAERIKDIASFKGIRSNQLVGYGLVVGLNKTGDGGDGLTKQTIANMMERMGIQVLPDNVNGANVAAVMVTAEMPPFSRIGNRIDSVVSSIGGAKSLEGGTLLMTPLRGVDGAVYALAQGPVGVGGKGTQGENARGGQNHFLVARIPGGASVEKEIPMSLNNKNFLTLTLKNADFTTAMRISESINSAFGDVVSKALDSGTVRIDVPETLRDNVAKYIADIETLTVTPDTVAKVVINERTGTVVIGENVRISTVAISHGDFSIAVIDPATGEVKTDPATDKNVTDKVLELKNGTNLGELVQALNALGVTPNDLISILQSIKAAGALQADLEII